MRKKIRNVRRKRRISQIFAVTVCTAIALLIAALAVTPRSYNLQVGDITPETITATREVEDTVTTNLLRQRARDAVQDIYVIDGAKTVDILDNVERFFTEVAEMRPIAQSMLAQHNQPTMQDGVLVTPDPQTYEEALTESEKESLLSYISITLTEEQLFAILNLPDSQLNAAINALNATLEERLKQGVKEEDVVRATQEIQDAVFAVQGVTQAATNVVMLPVSAHMRSNQELDEEATEAARKKAEDAVSPVIYKAGQAIVREGEALSEVHIALLSSLGMLQSGTNFWMYLGIFLLVLFVAAACVLYNEFYGNGADTEPNLIWVCGIAICVTMLLSMALSRVDVRIVPTVFAAMVVATTVGPGTGGIIGIMTCGICSVIALGAGVDAQTTAVYTIGEMLACFAVAVLTKKYKSRASIMVTGVLTGVISAIVFASVAMLMKESIHKVLPGMLYCMASGVIAGILCVGSSPLWEGAFHIVTNMRLMELCNASSPLLKRLSLEAPGTYHHAIMVANLAEAAAEEIGANAMLARAGAYYHDIGKLAAPQYYSENQTPDFNPHSLLSPEESAKLISRHPHDGARMLTEAGIPKPVVDIALQHHGTGVILYFYNEALKQNPDADIEHFRHTGGLPRSAEAAIIMLADSVEAAVRSDPTDYQEKIRKIIKSRLEDGQLDRAPLSLADLSKIGDAFESVLYGAYHNRVKYPELDAAKAKQLEGSVRA